jgi:hypothetical protein
MMTSLALVLRYREQEPVDNVPVGIALQEIDARIRSDRFSNAQTEADTSNTGHHPGSRPYLGQARVRLSTPARAVARSRRPHFNTGTLLSAPPGGRALGRLPLTLPHRLTPEA